VDQAEARRRIGDGMASLIQQRQFFGFLLQQLEIRHDPTLEAGMAVAFDGSSSRLVLLFNQEFWVQPLSEPWIWGVTPTEPWTDGNLVGVLNHEGLHIVLGHLTRCGGRHQDLWGIATDMVINQQLKGLPRGCIDLAWGGRTYPRDLHADGYYLLLEKDNPPCPQHGHAKAEAASGAQGAGAGKPGRPCPHCSGQTLDSHARWNANANVEAEQAARDAVASAKGRYEKANGEGEGRGTMPGFLERAIEALLHRPYPWQRKLRCIGQSALRVGHRATRLRRNRKYGILYPGRKPQRRGKVIVAVDTSGSITQEMLAAFWVEIRAMAKKLEVIVMECDAGLHAVWRVKGRRAPPMRGGGGSDFTPVFDLLAGRDRRSPRRWRSLATGATHVVLLTDGDITVPAACSKGLKVFWAEPKGNTPPTLAYGELVPIELEA
jgi:hypothetical protein